MSFSFIHFCFCLFLFSFVHSLNNSSTTLDTLLQDYAFETMGQHHLYTGALYKAKLPANVSHSGIQVSVVRLRSRELWRKGANFSCFCIPSRTLPIPYVKRLGIAYQDLGNWSSLYYAAPGYSLLTSVVGFMVFDASNVSNSAIRKLGLNTMGRPISIRFSNSTFTGDMIARTRCVVFSANGSVSVRETSSGRVCHSEDQGHFSIAVPLGKKRHKRFWMLGVVIGFVAIVVSVAYMGLISTRRLKAKRIQVMERQADKDLVLQTIWVGSSKLPSAAVTRTLPVLENGRF